MDKDVRLGTRAVCGEPYTVLCSRSGTAWQRVVR